MDQLLSTRLRTAYYVAINLPEERTRVEKRTARTNQREAKETKKERRQFNKRVPPFVKQRLCARDDRVAFVLALVPALVLVAVL